MVNSFHCINSVICVIIAGYFSISGFKCIPYGFSWNADMLPDLLMETSPGNRSIWLAR